jgi:hypothetical protein
MSGSYSAAGHSASRFLNLGLLARHIRLAKRPRSTRASLARAALSGAAPRRPRWLALRRVSGGCAGLLVVEA